MLDRLFLGLMSRAHVYKKRQLVVIYVQIGQIISIVVLNSYKGVSNRLESVFFEVRLGESGCSGAS